MTPYSALEARRLFISAKNFLLICKLCTKHALLAALNTLCVVYLWSAFLAGVQSISFLLRTGVQSFHYPFLTKDRCAVNFVTFA